MKLKFSDMSNMIAQEVMQQMAPLIRKIVREEVRKGAEKVIKEQRIVREDIRNESGYNFDNSIYDNTSSNNADSNNAKEVFSQKTAARAKSKEILENQFSSEDPFASLIMNAEDPLENKRVQEGIIADQPLIKSTDVNKGDVTLPELMDFSDRIDRII
tara:strand:+ start:342 stop:815 length:474 start_codon:yes stop_codon:yes gene_type:complete